MSAAGPSLRLRQVQRHALTMTPALQQSLRLLQFTADDLGKAIDEALESNPLLEADEIEASSPVPDAQRLRPHRELGFTPYAGLAIALGGRRGPHRVDGEENAGPVESVGASIDETLTEEIAFGFASPAEREIAHALGGLLDEAGYLACSVDEVAAACGEPVSTVETVLARLQTIFGTGLFARSLGECLALQLEARGTLDAPIATLLDNLDLVAEGRIDRLSRLAEVDDAAVVEMIATIRSLDPRPGLASGAGTASTVIPDLILSRYSDGAPIDSSRAFRIGSWLLEINPALLPRLGIDESRYNALRRAARQAEAHDYLSERLREARWLLRTLDFRTAAILKIGAAIVGRQSAFFETGLTGLRPLTRREVAESAEVHESTVSRAVAGKYLASPRGTLDLGWFFSAAIPDTDGGPPHSARRVRHRIRELIRAEDQPLSDASLTLQLRAEGFALARRTVAKHRKMLGIMESAQRRRWRRLGRTEGAG